MSETASPKKNFKDTLNLPTTGFAMKANLVQNEPQSLKRWQESELYQRIQESRDASDAPRFVFHDGPPYTSGHIHIGQLLNKVLKDFVVRTRIMAGMSCPYVPGWDCHGLPIEHKVMQEFSEKGKLEKLNALSEGDRCMAIRRECHNYATKFQKLQVAQMVRLLTLADYDHPYLTMTPDYERGVLEVFADLVGRGLVYRALKSVHWSIENETALAEAELEYYDREDLSVYVDFEAADRDAVARAFDLDEIDETPSFMIWTTTPWTLPANLAIAVNEKFEYALVRADGALTIMAKELVAKVTGAAKSEDVDILATTTGDRLVGLCYRHPFCDRTSPLVAADYVTLEDGTGLVHTAPGHGEDDYRTGLREGFDIYCPVRANGTYDDTVPEFLRGMSIWDANEKITEHLNTSGHLFYSHRFTHSYPHDWRGKTPVIFRATDQWFIGVDETFGDAGTTLRDRAIAAAEREIRFIPEWGRNRMRGMLESRPDWCLSRQRSWGLPIPAFRNSETDEILLTEASVRAVARVIGQKGSDAWFTEPVSELLKHYDPKSDPHAPDWINSALSTQNPALSRMFDIFDVWFESGTSWNAVMRQRGLGYPCDLYLEGSDQHRGWFQTSLLPALGATGQSPYKSVLTHGFIVDKDGRKMSKSGGNAIAVSTLLEQYGADICRWWVSSLAYENDIKADLAFFDRAGESYRKVRNTLRFLLSNLSDFAGQGSEPSPESIDAWALAMTAKLNRDVRAAYEAYDFKRAHQALYDFCNETLSAVYCAAVKDRLYCDAADSPRRRVTQAVMWHILEALLRLLAPILPHTADEAFRAMAGEDDSHSIHMQTFLDLDFAAARDWPAVMAARERALKSLEDAKSGGVENPLDAGLTVPDPQGTLARFGADFADLCGVSRAQFDPAAAEVVVHDLRTAPRCERCWKRTEDTEPRAGDNTLCDRCAAAIAVV